MRGGAGRSGQVAIFLVLVLAGLALLFSLNIDLFTSSRSKIRLQNAADAGALAIARWQGMSLNVIGDLNIAHLAAVCESNVNAMAGIVALQRSVARIGPTAGFKAANDIARANGAAASPDMTEAARIAAGLAGADYASMVDGTLRDGVCAGIDNAAVVRAGSVDPRLDPDFYDAIRSRDFRALCVRFANGSHSLPSVPPGAPDPDEALLSDGVNACFGSIGVRVDGGGGYPGLVGSLAALAREYGFDTAVSEAALAKNASLFAEYGWFAYDQSEWAELPAELGFSRFPWLTPLQERYDTAGGAATVRVEGAVALTSIAAQTNAIAALAAAKALGSVRSRRVTDVAPPIVLPSFSQARLVPFAFGAATGRRGMANLGHVRAMSGLLGQGGGASAYGSLLDAFGSDEFRSAAEKWYAEHGHTDADGCRPPSRHGTERGGGTSYGI